MYAMGQKNFIKAKMTIVLMCLLMMAMLSGCSLQKDDITMLAAASTKDALTEAANAYMASHENVSIHLSFGGSGALAEQIIESGNVDLFLSASTVASKKVEKAGRAVSQLNLLSNQLVMIQPVTDSYYVGQLNDLREPQVTKIALGEPKSVPAGTYAQKVLEDADLMTALSEKCVYGKDVREVLSWVAAGEANVGFVYQTDAMLEPLVSVVKTFDASETGDIIYPLVLTNSKDNEAATQFMNWLRSEAGMSYFIKYGFKSGAEN